MYVIVRRYEGVTDQKRWRSLWMRALFPSSAKCRGWLLLLVANRAWRCRWASPSFTQRSAPVALSSTRVWILLASVVALGIVLVGAVAFASPEKDAINHETARDVP